MIRLLAGLLFVGTLAVAQIVPCQFGDDGFNLGCCSTPQPNLPQFPNLQFTGRYGCIRDCSLEASFPQTVGLSFSWIQCDLALMSFTSSSTAVCGPTFSGGLVAKYSRTWREISPTGAPTQVWRFLVNGDMTYALTSACATAVPCPIPPEVPLGLPVHMVGHVDYICDSLTPTTGPFRVEMSLTHFNGCLSHAPWTTFPLAGPAAHTDRSYHLVAPGNFVFAPVAPVAGPVIADAVRSSTLVWGPPTLYQCHGEQRVQQGDVTILGQECLSCGPTPAIFPLAYTQERLTGVTACGGTTSLFSTIPFPPVTPGGMITLGLGSWVPTAVSPVSGDLHVHIGVMDYTDPCTGEGPFHVVTGVTTHDPANPGQLFSPLGPGMVFPTFRDLQNVNLLPLYPSVAAPPHPGWGSVFVSTIVWNLNLP